MTDREALLKAIVANPKADAPRLMYADEIEGDFPEYAEFIRLQCDGHRLLGRLTPDQVGRWLAIERRCDALVVASAKSGRLFAEDVDYFVPREPVELPRHNPGRTVGTFARGFVERLWTTWEQWCERHLELCARHPIRTVRLADAPAPIVSFDPERDRYRVEVRGGPLRLWTHAREPGVMFRDAVRVAVRDVVTAHWPGVGISMSSAP